MSLTLCPDVLNLIAQEINDHKTWHSFSVCCRNTSRAAKKIEDNKKEKFVTVVSYDHDSPCGNTYATDLTFWHPNGARYKIESYNGEWLRSRVEFKNGYIALTMYHLNGNISRYQEYSSFPYSVYNMTGKSRVFNPDGKLIEEGNYLKGYKVGRWITYWNHGTVCTEEVYDEDSNLLSSKKYMIDCSRD